jgi:hypothetical protein
LAAAGPFDLCTPGCTLVVLNFFLVSNILVRFLY